MPYCLGFSNFGIEGWNIEEGLEFQSLDIVVGCWLDFPCRKIYPCFEYIPLDQLVCLLGID